MQLNLQQMENPCQKDSSRHYDRKKQMLIDHLKHLHLGLALVVNIGENVATVKIYDNYVEDSLKLHVTLSNLWDIEDQLYRLWIEVNGVIQSYLHE